MTITIIENPSFICMGDNSAKRVVARKENQNGLLEYSIADYFSDDGEEEKDDDEYDEERSVKQIKVKTIPLSDYKKLCNEAQAINLSAVCNENLDAISVCDGWMLTFLLQDDVTKLHITLHCPCGGQSETQKLLSFCDKVFDLAKE